MIRYKRRLVKKKKRQTTREHLPSPHIYWQIFPQGEEKFYWCHVTLDWLTIIMAEPDLFSMAFETGLNLVGLSVAMNVWIEMMNSGKWFYMLPHFYWKFNSPSDYSDAQQKTFDILSTLPPLISEDLQMATIAIRSAGGGLGVQLPMTLDWLEQVSLAQVKCLDILNKVYKSKEFTFIEYDLADPEFGSMMFNNITFGPQNGNKISADPNKFFGVNWNILNPQRFEQWMKPFVKKIYDDTVSFGDIYKDMGWTTSDTELDSIVLAWDRTDSSSSDWFVNDIAYSWNMSENREKTNLILTYTNRPVNSPTEWEVTKIQALDENGVTQFFRAASWFLQQPFITNYLYERWLRETHQDDDPSRRLYPSRITSENWDEFTGYWKKNYYYGKPLGSNLSNLILDDIQLLLKA